MPIKHDPVLYSEVREEHMVHNDFFLRYLEFDGEAPPSVLSFLGESCQLEDTVNLVRADPAA